MGFSTAQAYAESAQDGAISLATAVSAHLLTNCYPPVHSDFHPFAVEAIRLAQQEDWDASLELPNGRVVSAEDAISQLHLHVFL